MTLTDPSMEKNRSDLTRETQVRAHRPVWILRAHSRVDRPGQLAAEAGVEPRTTPGGQHPQEKRTLLLPVQVPFRAAAHRHPEDNRQRLLHHLSAALTRQEDLPQERQVLRAGTSELLHQSAAPNQAADPKSLPTLRNPLEGGHHTRDAELHQVSPPRPGGAGQEPPGKHLQDLHRPGEHNGQQNLPEQPAHRPHPQRRQLTFLPQDPGQLFQPAGEHPGRELHPLGLPNHEILAELFDPDPNARPAEHFRVPLRGARNGHPRPDRLRLRPGPQGRQEDPRLHHRELAAKRHTEVPPDLADSLHSEPSGPTEDSRP